MERLKITSAVDNVLDIQTCLTCYLCGEIYRRPRILPCGHTFCSECLGKLKDEILRDGHNQKTEIEYSDFMDSQNKSDSSDSGPLHDHSSNVDLNKTDSDPSCYRPKSSNQGEVRRPSSKDTDQQLTNGMARSNTFLREKQPSHFERSSSRYSAPAGLGAPEAACSKCGHVSPKTLPRRAKSAQITSPPSRPRDTSAPAPRWNTSPQRSSHLMACSFDQKHGKEMEQFACPIPECNYSLRVMNLARWSPKNNAVSDIIGVWRTVRDSMKDVSTQTDISNNHSVLVTIPRSLIDNRSLQPLGRRRRHSSMMDMAIDSAISMDSLERGYVPVGHLTWRSYAAMVGMNILQQIVHI
ncbi:unnamed protein product [Lymnaea stagnalis]|uniref:RING-type domain-containing protein n=1 Tax=Lymnaea stagnalis TaxID=6523 RepID=A0AAV2IDU6_LYMST